MGLKEALKSGQDIRHGREILQNLRNRSTIRFYGNSVTHANLYSLLFFIY